MRYRCYTAFFSLLFAQLITGCDTTDPANDFRPGFLVLEDAYDLGDLKSTDTFVFEISNEGDSDLTGIHLTSSNSAFVISPDFIPVLRSRANQSFTQSIRVTALHGTSPTGIGRAPLMTQGINLSLLQINAKTVNMSGDTLTIQQQTTMSVRALLVDIELEDDNGLHLLNSYVGNYLRTPVSPWITRGYDATGPLRVKNTGNVDLSIRVFKRRTDTFSELYNESDLLLATGQEVTIERKSSTALRFDGGNTISDVEQLPIQPDGYIYMFID